MNSNIKLKNFKGFAIVLNDLSVEALGLRMYCLSKDIELKKVSFDKNCPDGYVPLGSVEWCLKSLGRNIEPDYFPAWAKDHLYRKVWKQNSWIADKKLFVKPADVYKRFTGFVISENSKQKDGDLIYSEVVSFENEWRYYVSYGQILCSGWYAGNEEDMPDPPELNINIPKEYCGALDFGTLPDGKIALVEAHHPFACGWYGEKQEEHMFFQWIVDGWDYMVNG